MSTSLTILVRHWRRVDNRNGLCFVLGLDIGSLGEDSEELFASCLARAFFEQVGEAIS